MALHAVDTDRHIWPSFVLGFAVMVSLASAAPYRSFHRCIEIDCGLYLLEIWAVTLLAGVLAILAAAGGRRHARNAAIFMAVLTLANLANVREIFGRGVLGYGSDFSGSFHNLIDSLLVTIAIPLVGLLIVGAILWWKSRRRSPKPENPGSSA